MTDADRCFVIRLASSVLALVIVGMVFTLLAGLFSPAVDNDKVFAILGPAFSTTIGVFVGVLGGMRMSGDARPKELPGGQ